MERRRDRGHGSRVVLAAGVALVSFWVVSGLSRAGAAETEAPVPRVSIQPAGDGLFTQDTPACGQISSRSLGPGALELRRTGPTVADLTVRYGITADDVNDFDALSGSVTIPAGAATVSIIVSPRFTDRPAPVHVHRSAPVAARVFDDAAYDVEGGGVATIALRFDIDIEGCPPVTPAGPPAAPIGSPAASPAAAVRPASTTAAPSASPAASPATLPFTGSPVTHTLAGVGTALVALGGAGLRYGRPRARRNRRRRRA